MAAHGLRMVRAGVLVAIIVAAIGSTVTGLAGAPVGAVGERPERSGPAARPGAVESGGAAVEPHIRPDSLSITVYANTSGNVATFKIRNLNEFTKETYDLTCFAEGAVTSCSTKSVQTVAPLGTVTVSVTFDVGAAGTGRVVLRAQDQVNPQSYDEAGTNVTVMGGPPGAPSIDISMNPPLRLDRPSCVTSAAGAAGVFQCGELLLAHSMPAFRSLGRDRWLTLLYNSATARPYPVIMADVWLDLAVDQPDSLRVSLSVGGVPRGTWWYSAARLSPGGPRERLAVGFDASSLPTGVYPYTLEVANVYGTSVHPAQASGELIVVNRTQSPYGAGWSIAGIEQLYTGQRGGAVLLVDGDGSAAVYEPIGTNLWLAPAGAYRDTLRYGPVSDPAVPPGSYYWRRLLDGTVIYYNGAGLQKWVVDRVKNKVEYAYVAEGTPASGLSYIRIAPHSANRRYTFTYTSGKLSFVVDPVSPTGRALGVTVNVAGDLTELRDPGFSNKPIRLEYDSSHRLKSWSSRRGARSAFTYFGQTALLAADTLPEPAGNRAYRVFTPVQTRGYATLAAGLNTTVASSSASLEIDGPRTDVTDRASFWVNRHGAPTKIVDALGHITTITYDSVRSLLPSRIQFPDGRVTKMAYDGSARLIWAISSEAHADTSFFEYGSASARERPTVIRTPREGTERDVTRYYYNSLGLPDSIVDPRGHKTTFSYDQTTGLVLSTAERKVRIWRSKNDPAAEDSVRTTFQYTTDGLLNLQRTTTPLGHYTILSYDNKGNVSKVVRYAANGTALDSTKYTYGDLNWLTAIHQFGIDRHDQLRQYTTTISYDDDGNRRALTDPRGITRQWFYDGLGRDTMMTDELGFSERRVYDPAGNLTLFRDRMGDSVTFTYDALGRVQRKIIGEVKVDGWNTYEMGLYSGLPNQRILPGDTITFEYDPMGRPKRIENNAALIVRNYDLRGAIVADSQYNKAVGSWHKLQYTYTAGGLRKTMRSRWAGGDRIVTYYYGIGAAVDSMVVSTGERIRFRWDPLGRRDSVALSNGTWIRYRYDADGNLRELLAQQGTKTLAGLTWVAYDAAGRPDSLEQVVVDGAVSGIHAYSWKYDGRGHLQSYVLWPAFGPIQARQYRYDESGNRVLQLDAVPGWPSSDSTVFRTYEEAGQKTNRIRYREVYGPGDVSPGLTYHYIYDRNGNLLVEADNNSVPISFHRYYDPAGRLLSTRAASTPDSLFFRYDGLGRLVKGAYGNRGATFFYDGDNVIRMGDAEFLHGPGLDDPIVMYAPPAFSCFPDDSARVQMITYGERLYGFRSWKSGLNCMDRNAWSFYGAYSGAIAESHTFELSRIDAGTEPGSVSYFRNRWYDARLGRFTQEDPIGFAGGLNLYAYAGNNPASYTDPFGLSPDQDPCKGFFGCLAEFVRMQVRGFAAGADVTRTSLAENEGRFGAILGRLSLALGTSATASSLARGSTTVTVVHFTSVEGAAAIEASGALRAGSFVTLPSQVRGMGPAAVEALLEIQPGRGAMSATFTVPRDILTTPFNGPVTSGGATQFQLLRSVPLRPGSFVPNPF